ncbi:MAG: ATP-binding cassette domain-containing protein [Pirellulaceae bacterium]
MSFDVPVGQVLGLIGENGAGKSTLMNIIGGVLLPDVGRMTISGTSYAPTRLVTCRRQGSHSSIKAQAYQPEHC